MSKTQQSLTLANLNTPVKCSCDGGGWLYENDTARPCSCQVQKKLESRFKASKITPAFKSKTFKNYITQGRPPIISKMRDSALHYTQHLQKLEENNWLVLLGRPGSGKTHLLMATANALIPRGVQALYFPHKEGMGEIMQGISDRTINPKMEQMKTVQLLLWDDFLKPLGERPKCFEIAVAFEVLNYRYLNLLPTVVSSELLPGDLLAVDEALASRIIERGKGHITIAQGDGLNYRLL